MDKRKLKKVVCKRHLNRKISQAVKDFFSINEDRPRLNLTETVLNSSSLLPQPHSNILSNQQPNTSNSTVSSNSFQNLTETVLNSSSFIPQPHSKTLVNQQPSTSNSVFSSNTFQSTSNCTVTFNEIHSEKIETNENILDFDYFSSDSDDSQTPVGNETSLEEKLRIWSLENEISLKALSELLKIFSPYHSELPVDGRTLLHTPRFTEVKFLENGRYSHIGLKNGIFSKLRSGWKSLNCQSSQSTTSILIDVNVDGFSPYKSSSLECWPILGRSPSLANQQPFVIGVFLGKGKPKSIEDFLSDFIAEVADLRQHGLEFNGVKHKCDIRFFLCDAPARSYMKQIVGHNGRKGCERCDGAGKYVDHCMTFPNCSGNLRTDQSFNRQEDVDHHRGNSPLQGIDTQFISQFPLDPMHLIYLGVVRRLIFCWVGIIKSTARLRAKDTNDLSQKLLEVGNYICCEFSRKCRGLRDVKKWKATEFRLFVLYVGPVVLKNILPSPCYQHFMLLHTAVVIMSSESMCKKMLFNAGELLKMFVMHAKSLYGSRMLTYNVHNLLHICDDVNRYGALENFSCFPFENKLGSIKKMIRTPNNPLQQITRRISEHEAAPNLVPNAGLTTNQTLKQQHNTGPVFVAHETATQYRKIELNKYVLSTSRPNDCCQMKNGSVCLIKNIFLLENGKIDILVQEFKTKKDFYTYPCESTKLGVQKVSQLSGLKIYSLECLKCKCLLIPLRESEWVAMPLLNFL